MGKHFLATAALLLSSLSFSFAARGMRFDEHPGWEKVKRQYYPAEATGVKTFKTPRNVTIRYKEPGSEGVCETTPGVNSYSGFIDLAENVHVFFYFFESRRNPAKDDLTLWLNGGPGADSLIGLFQELGPCRISEDLESYLNPYSWNNVSNMLFLSQPVGTGFSNQGLGRGALDSYMGSFINLTGAAQSGIKETGTWPLLDPLNEGEIDTTDLAAIACWEILQGFLSALPQFKANDAVAPKNFNLWTESYGGHYGPAFFNHFQAQNKLIQNGSLPGYELNFNSLGIINGIISERIQAPYYPEFAVNNTYGIKAYNDTVYGHAIFNLIRPNGCLDSLAECDDAGKNYPGAYYKGRITPLGSHVPAVAAICSEAYTLCRDTVEGIYYSISDQGTYDIRHPWRDPTPEKYFTQYLNQAHIQNALGVSSNYTNHNENIYWAFQQVGDWIYPNFLKDLEDILNSGVRVVLAYADADYICNWFGGEAVSLQVEYKHSKQFRAAGYAPFVWSPAKLHAGDAREYGNFSFVRIFDAGHEMPYYQPGPALELFERAIMGLDIAEGLVPVTANLTTTGPPKSNHTNSWVPPPKKKPKLEAWGKSLIASYTKMDQSPEPTVAPYPPK